MEGRKGVRILMEETATQVALDRVDDLKHQVREQSRRVREVTDEWDRLMRQLHTARTQLKYLLTY